MEEEEKKPQRIQSFLSRFAKIVPQDKKVKIELIQFLQQEYNIYLQDNEIRVVRGHIYLRTTPIQKIEILRRKQHILEVLEKKLALKDILIS